MDTCTHTHLPQHAQHRLQRLWHVEQRGRPRGADAGGEAVEQDGQLAVLHAFVIQSGDAGEWVERQS